MAKAYKRLRRERTERRLKNQEFHGTIEGEALANLPSLACLAAWDHGKLNASFEQDGEVQALYREAAGFDQSQGKTVR